MDSHPRWVCVLGKVDTVGVNLAPAVKLIKEFEGYRSKAYQDVVGVWTIAFGRTSGVKPGDTCTLEQAEAWLEEDIRESRLPVVRTLVKVPLTDNQICALVSFCYNLGNGAFKRSSLLKAINEGWDVRSEFMQYIHAGGKILTGLVRRRKAEADLYFS